MTRIFLEGTQRGYAVGIRKVLADGSDGRTIYEEYHRDNGTTASIDAAYDAASRAAASLEYTWKHRPNLIRRREGFRA